MKLITKIMRKSKTSQHLIFFDDTCSLCWRSVNRIFSWDRKKKFRFSPIRDPSAKMLLKDKWNELKGANTLILIENYNSKEARIWVRGRAVMRILWLLGGWKKLPGALAFIPFGTDALYCFVAKRRHRF